MTTTIKIVNPDIEYPSSDGEALAETYIHLYAILTTLGEKLLIPTELAEKAEQERQRADKLAEHLRRRVGVASRREAACR